MPGGSGTILTNNPLGFCISSFFSFCDKTLAKSKLKVKIYLVTGSSREARERAQSKNMEAGIEAETIERHCLLCCSPLSLSLILISYTIQECPSRGGTVTVGHTIPYQSLIKKVLTDMYHRMWWRNNSLIDYFFSQRLWFVSGWQKQIGTLPLLSWNLNIPTWLMLCPNTWLENVYLRDIVGQPSRQVSGLC